MEGQATQHRPNVRQQEIAVFDNRNAAEKAKSILQQAELSLQNISIQGEIDPYEEVAAMGTTVGAEAGLLIGAFMGGTIGLIAYSIYSTQLYGELVNTPFNQLFVAAFTIAGAIFGVISGNRIRSSKLPQQKQKGNPDVPRRFQLLVEGTQENLAKAQEMLGYPAS
jgi:hypothetical protein